jgi:hypothetical protein
MLSTNIAHNLDELEKKLKTVRIVSSDPRAARKRMPVLRQWRTVFSSPAIW